MKAKFLAVLGSLHSDESGRYLIDNAHLGLLNSCASVAGMGTLVVSLNTADTSTAKSSHRRRRLAPGLSAAEKLCSSTWY